jgi:hypothetical protein
MGVICDCNHDRLTRAEREAAQAMLRCVGLPVDRVFSVAPGALIR